MTPRCERPRPTERNRSGSDRRRFWMRTRLRFCNLYSRILKVGVFNQSLSSFIVLCGFPPWCSVSTLCLFRTEDGPRSSGVNALFHTIYSLFCRSWRAFLVQFDVAMIAELGLADKPARQKKQGSTSPKTDPTRRREQVRQAQR